MDVEDIVYILLMSNIHTLHLDDAADDVDNAGKYVDWFINHYDSIALIDKSGKNTAFVTGLWARFGRAQYILMSYKFAQQAFDTKEEPQPIDICNTTDDIHNRTSMGYYITRNPNRIRKILAK